MIVEKDVLPLLLRRGVYLVHDAQMRMRVGDLVPPVPAVAVDGRVGESMDVFDRSEVAARHEAVGLEHKSAERV